MSYKEMFKIISKAWSNVDDIMAIANCCRTSATEIRKEITKRIKQENKEVPYCKKKVVPTKRVMEYLDLDVEYIKDMALKEQEIENAQRKEVEYARIPR